MWSISDFDIENNANFYQVIMSRIYISRNELFKHFWTLLTDDLRTRSCFNFFLWILYLLIELDIYIEISWSYTQQLMGQYNIPRPICLHVHVKICTCKLLRSTSQRRKKSQSKVFTFFLETGYLKNIWFWPFCTL